MMRSSFATYAALTTMVLIVLAGPVQADEVVLLNGDRLTGTITRMEAGTLTLKTEYSAPVKIKAPQIKAITTTEAVTVRLVSGEVLKGRIVTDAEGRFTITPGPERELIVIFWPQVAAINPPPATWKGNVTVSANHQRGNTNRLSASVGAEATRKTEKDRIGLGFLSNYAEENNVLTTRNTFASLKYDYFLTRKLFGYLGIEMLSDEFRDLSLRTVVGPGMGYQFWDLPNRSLLFELGVTYFSEDYELGTDDHWVTGRVSTSLSLKLWRFLTFSEKVIYYPNLEDSKDYQVRNEAGIASAVGAQWSVKLTNIIEYDSMPSVSATVVGKKDVTWLLGIQYTF